MNPTITLTHEELTAVLSLCGYEHVASDMMNLFNLQSQEEAERFIDGTERTLAAKGYLNPERPNALEEGLEQLIHLLVQSKRKVRWVQGTTVRFIHQIAKQKLLIQEVENGQHQFSFHDIEGGIISALKRWYRPTSTVISHDMEFMKIEFTRENFEQLQVMSGEFAEMTIADQDSPVVFRQFIHDFFQNSNEFDNMSLMTSNYAKDEMKFEEIIFFLPSAKCVWYFDYSEVEEDQLYVTPLIADEFLETLEADIKKFMVAATPAN